MPSVSFMLLPSFCHYSVAFDRTIAMFPWLRTPLLKNTGSVARDHLASERTLLSWLRTGLGLVALGIGVERFSQFDIPALPTPRSKQRSASSEGDMSSEHKHDKTQEFVLTLLGTGGGAIVYGTTRYFSNMRLLEKGMFKPAFHGAAGLNIAVAGLTGVAYWGIIQDAEAKKKS